MISTRLSGWRPTLLHSLFFFDFSPNHVDNTMLLAGHGNAVLAAEHGFIKNDERNFVSSLQWSWRPPWSFQIHHLLQPKQLFPQPAGLCYEVIKGPTWDQTTNWGQKSLIWLSNLLSKEKYRDTSRTESRRYTKVLSNGSTKKRYIIKRFSIQIYP